MHHYPQVTTRFLRNEEKQVVSNELTMPLVIEAKDFKDMTSLKTFITTHSQQLMNDLRQYGALLFRGFDVKNEIDFEQTVLSIKGMQGISQAFMSEEGRILAGESPYVLHTNAVYKTGGTLYLGGFHSENYYSFDVPSYICFACFKPSRLGGETGLVNMKKIYQKLRPALRETLENQSFFVKKWLVSDVAKRYQVSVEKVRDICTQYSIPLIGEGKYQFMYLYKPNIFTDAITKEKSLQINLFEIYRLNANLRKCFMQDYASKEWFWHRFVWKLPKPVFKAIKFIFVHVTSFLYSPKEALQRWLSSIRMHIAERKNHLSKHLFETRVGRCFTPDDVRQLAKLIREEYCSTLWQTGDVLIVDNKQVAHAGMPGSGDRLIRAMICNPLNMTYTQSACGTFQCEARDGKEIGAHFTENTQSLTQHPDTLATNRTSPHTTQSEMTEPL